MAAPLKLLDGSSDEEPEFTINKNYAERYDVWRNKEELQKLKDLSKEIGSSSSESEEEEEPEIEKDFLKTLSLLKSKDPRIYDEKTEFFKEDALPKKTKIKKEKPMFMKDYERKIVLEQNGVFVDEDDSENEHLHDKQLLTNKEEEEIKKHFLDAAPDSDEDDLFQVRTKTKVEEEKEEADYKQWLETEKDMLFLNKCWNDPKIGEDEKFLRDYILNKRYVTDDKPGEIPMYDEITQDIDLLNEDEKDLERQELFEHKYNFRFEEPDEEFIKSYPRTIGDSLRRENSKRKQKREEYAERKKKEKEVKREELKRLKALKRKEIEEKFLKLKEASGQDELNFDESDIESDFDPDKHDLKMREMFNDDYYNVNEEQKPEFEFDEDIDDENWDRWTRDQMNHSQNVVDKSNEESYSEEEDESKTDFRSQFEQEMIDSSSNNKKRKGRKKSLFAKILSMPKPLYDPKGKSFNEYLDEYYRLDYEDIVGDMPVRFKYRKVVPNDFGLTVDEILAAQDKELNRWCSVKKTCQYRDDKDEIYDIQAFQKKAQNFDTKKKILASVYTPPEEEKIPQANLDNSNEVETKPKKKRKRSKKKKTIENSDSTEDMNSMQETGLSTDNHEIIESTELTVETNKESKRKKKKNKSLTNISGVLSKSQLHEKDNGLVDKEDNSVQETGLSTDNHEIIESTELTVKTNKESKRKKKKNKSLTNISEVMSKSQLHEKDNGLVDEEDTEQNALGQEYDYENSQIETNQRLFVNDERKKPRSKIFENDSVPNGESLIEADLMKEFGAKGSKNKKRKKSQSLMDDSSAVESYNEHQMNENKISKKKRRKLESLGKESLPCIIAEYDEKNSEAEAKNSQNVAKNQKLESDNEADLLSVKQTNKLLVKKPKSENNERTDSSFNTQNRNSIYAENSVENDTNRKNKKKHKNNKNQQFFSSQSSQKRNFYSQKFHNKNQDDINSVQIVDNSGKKIVSSNTRLSAFEINPKKFKNKLIYGKNQTKNAES